MALKLFAADGVKIYNLSSGKTLPEWVGEKKSKGRSSAGEEHVELLQDFQFPSACRKIKATASGDCLIATGNYPPQVRLFDVAQLSPKVTRHLDADIVDFQILTDDFSKLAFLCVDRTVKFHAKFGHYHETRIPLTGRTLTYVPFSAHLVIAGSASAIHRLDLSEGRFLEPLWTSLDTINACDLSPVHGLLCCAGSDGCVECLDPRQRSVAGSLDVAEALDKGEAEATSAKFSPSGLELAIGTSDGSVALFDLRSSKPTVVKDHMYDSAIHSLHYLDPQSKANTDQTNKIASSDQFVVKIWDTISGQTYTNVEPGSSAAINDLCWWSDSGLFFAACDDSRIQSYFIPSLGMAPSWCSFLESMTEELEEETGHVLYDDYRFVTQAELEDVGLSHLVGTELLKAYMHGYFVHNKLYSRARAMNKPPETTPSIAPESRISSEKTVRSTPKSSQDKDALNDERFRAIHEDPAFRIDEQRTNLEDSLLVPSDTLEISMNQERERQLDIKHDTSAPFEDRSRSANRRSKKIKAVTGATEFDFEPMATKKRRPVRTRKR